MAAAVADFRPRAPLPGRCRAATRRRGRRRWRWTPMPDLLAGLAGARRGHAALPGRLRGRDRRRRRAGARARGQVAREGLRRDRRQRREPGRGSASGRRTTHGDAALRGRRAASCLPRAAKRAVADRCGRCWRVATAQRPRDRVPDPRLKTYAPQASRHLRRAGLSLMQRQETMAGRVATCRRGRARTMSTFTARCRRSGCGRGTSACSGGTRGSPAPRTPAWAFVDAQREAVHPRCASTTTASDEAAYDCALPLIAIAAERALAPVDAKRQALGRSRGAGAGRLPRRAAGSVGRASSATRASWRWRSPTTRAPSTIAGLLAAARASSSIGRSA